MCIAKKDLYNKHLEVNEKKVDENCEEIDKEINFSCNLTIVQLDDDKDDNDIATKVAYTSVGEEVSNLWYFDSGCSRHMTRNENVFSTVVGGKVTFRDGAKGSIKEKGTLDSDDQPVLENVYYVEGLTANLISISQLCDDGLKVIFTKIECQAEMKMVIRCCTVFDREITVTCGRLQALVCLLLDQN